ncbi:hypothetical protein ACHAWC_007560 [Mediolabrus comicus]
MQRMATVRSSATAACRAAAAPCNASALGSRHCRLYSSRNNIIISIRSQVLSGSLLRNSLGICGGSAPSTNQPKILKRGFASDGGNKKSDFVVSKFDNSLKQWRELRTYVKNHLSLDIWALNIILVTLVVGPSIWGAMKAAPHTDDDYAFSIPVDDPVEHSVRILMDSTGSNDHQSSSDPSTPNVKSRKSGNNKDKTTIISPEEDAKRILNDLLGSENVRTTASRVASNVIQSPPFQNAVKALVKNVRNDLVNDPETSIQLTSLVQSVLQNQRIYDAVKVLLLQLINDEEVYNELTKLVVQLGEERDVLKATQKLLTESAHATLNDPDVLDHSMEFATEVVGDDVVQRTGGEALRNTVGYAVQPTGGAVLAGLGTIALVGLHFYFSRGNNSASTGNASGNSGITSNASPLIQAQPSVPSIGTSSSNAWAHLFEKLASIPCNVYDLIRTAMAKVSSINGTISSACWSSWGLIYSFSSMIGNSTIAIYNFIVSNTIHLFTVGASSWRHITIMWKRRGNLSSDTSL